MQCPKCGKEGLKYRYPKRKVEIEDKNKKKIKVLKRATNEVKCSKCGYEGVYND